MISLFVGRIRIRIRVHGPMMGSKCSQGILMECCHMVSFSARLWEEY